MNRWLIALAIAFITAIIPTGAISQSRIIEMGITSSEMAQFFQQHAGANDIARVDHPGDIGLIANITVGKKMAIFKSASQIEQFLASNASSIDIVGWNLEPGQTHDANELANPVAAVKRVRAVADRYGKALAIGLTHDLTIRYGAAMAKFADIWVLQIQKAQNDPTMAGEFVRQMVPVLKKANPAIQVFVQIRTDTQPAALVRLVNGLGDVNVSILTQRQDVSDAIAVAGAFFGSTGKASNLQNTNSTSAQWISDYGIRLKSRDGKWMLPVATRLLGSTDDDHVKRGSINSWDLSAAIGTPAFAAAPGKVVAAGCYLYETRQWAIMQGYGCAIQIDHGGGIASQYGHCGEGTVAVKSGQMVDQNTLLCRVGRTGVTSFNHMHFTILKNGSPVRIDELFDIKQMRYCHLCSGNNNPNMQIATQSQSQQRVQQQSTNRLMALLQMIAQQPADQLANVVFMAVMAVGLLLWLGGLWLRVTVIGLGSGLVGTLTVAILLMPVTPVVATNQQTVAVGGDWEKAYQIVQGNEGWKCTNDGAYTMGGVAQGTYNRWRAKNGMGNADVCASLTREQAKEIFRDLFWIPVGAEKMPFNLALTVVDHYYVTGKVSHLLAQCGTDVKCFNDARIIDFRSKSNCNLYCAGWINRVNKIRKLTQQ